MTVRSPQFKWIGDLEELGPPGDPSILLVGQASIGASPCTVKAVRVRANQRIPDYRDNVGSDDYAPLALEALLQELEILADTIQMEQVTLDTGTYVICVIPSEHRK